MNRTKIEWCQNPDGTPGYTWNPITGCLNGCSYCYARKLAETRLKERMLANKNIASKPEAITINEVGKHLQDPFYPRLWRSRLGQLGNPFDASMWHKSPKGIFVCSMGDLFGEGVPVDWTAEIMTLMADTPHRFYLLTKQPQNLARWSPFPENCWVGVSVTTPEQAHWANFDMAEVEAKVSYLSFEPLLAPVADYLYFKDLIKCVDWIIIGAQTKPYIAPRRLWIDEITAAAKSANIPVFHKNSLRQLMGVDLIQQMPE